MFLKEPVLCQRIPTWPWADPAGRHIVHYDEYVATGGYEGLRQALRMERGEIIEVIKDSLLRGRGGAGISLRTEMVIPSGSRWRPSLPRDQL